MIKLFLVIFRSVKRFFKIFLNCFSDPVFCSRLQSVDLFSEQVDLTRSRSTGSVDRRAQICARLADTGRSTVRVDRDESRALCLFGSTGAVDR